MSFSWGNCKIVWYTVGEDTKGRRSLPLMDSWMSWCDLQRRMTVVTSSSCLKLSPVFVFTCLGYQMVGVCPALSTRREPAACYCAPTPSSWCFRWSGTNANTEVCRKKKIAFNQEYDIVFSLLHCVLGTWTCCWSCDPHKHCLMYIISMGESHDLFVITHTNC